MGASINRFNGGLDQDTNIQDYSQQKYVDAMNMRIISKGDFQVGSIENEKGMVASLSFTTAVRIYSFDVTTSGNWVGTLAISGESGSPFNVSCLTTDSWVTGITATPQAVPDGENAPPVKPKYAGLKTSTWMAFQYNNRITIITLANQTVTLTRSSGSGVLTATATPYISSGTDQRIIGYTTLRDRIIAFTTSTSNNTTTPSGTTGFIWSVNFNTNGTVSSTTLLYGGVLNFSRANSITAKSFYINERYGKVYFVDNYNNLRHFNAYDPVLFSKQPNQLDLISDISFVKPQIVDVLTGGNYKSGVAQYAYQLYNKYGSESIMSPVSNLIPLTVSVDNNGSTDYFLGSPVDEPTGKSVQVNISSVDNRFEYIRLYALYYSTDLSTPEIRIVAEQKIVLKSTGFNLVDDGFTSLGSITLQEFRNYYKNVFGAKSIELQNNRLVTACLKEGYFDVDYDARAYRWNVGGSLIKIDSATRGTIPNNTTEKYIDAKYTVTDYDTYKYQSSGGVLGGSGTNVSYTFSCLNMELDSLYNEFSKFGASKQKQAWSSLLGSNFLDNNSYTNYASPINSSQMVGYKRGEIYRFGIFFRDSKGRVSPVKWIGDIKMPEVYDSVGTTFVQTTDQTPQFYSNYADQFPTILIPELEDQYYIYQSNPASHTLNFGLDSFHQFKIVIGTTQYLSTAIKHSTDVPYSLADYISDARNFLTSTGLDDTFDFEYGITNDNPAARTAYFKFIVKNEDPLTATINIYLDYSTASDYTFANTTGSAGTTSATTGTNDYVINIRDGAKNKITARILYPIFTVTGIPVDEWGNTCSYQIVRAERTERDKTIIAQGLLTNTLVAEKNTSIYLPKVLGQTSLNGQTITTFISPEINFRKSAIRNDDSLTIIGTAKSVTSKFDGRLVKVNAVIPLASFSTYDIVDTGIVKADTDILAPKMQRVKDYRIYNTIISSATDSEPWALGGTSLFIAHASITDAIYMAAAEIRRTLSDQYGGNTYYDRLNTEYIDCGHWRSGTDATNVNPVLGGDTYIAMFDYQRAMWTDKNYIKEDGTRGDFDSHVFLPVETSINLDYRYDRSYTKALNYYGDTSKYIQEYAGDYSGKVGHNADDENKSLNYTQEYDLYLENPVYSKANNINKYLAQPLEVDGEETDCMIRVSEQFSYNSITDDLIKFLPINFKIVETQYGKITHLTTFKDNILFFQEKAIGIQPIAERTVIQDNQGIGLVLGTGDLFSNHQYISKTSGSKNKASIITTDYGIYYFDSRSKTFNRLQQGLSEISTIKGLSSYFETNVPNGVLSYDNPMGGSGVHAGYDKNNKRVFFSVLYTTTLWTVSFNELTETFESFHTFVPRYYLTDNYGNLHSEDPSVLGTYYAHGKGNYGKYYNNDYVASTITYLNNDKPTITKKFTNIELDYRIGAISLQSATDTYRADMISKIKFWNDYQTTIDLPVVIYSTPPTPGTNIGTRQRFGLWRIALPLSATNSPTNDAATINSRFYDKHLFTKLTYTNTSSNKRFVLNNAITYYQD